MTEQANTLVIGGGPSGIFAAITAARQSGKPRRIVLLEHNHMPGRKLGKTGNGRCNLTNRQIAIERYHGADTRFLHNVLPRFTNEDLLGWFEERGVEFKEEDRGCIFPVTDQASTIVDILKEEVERCGVTLHLGVRAEELVKDGQAGFIVRCSGGKSFNAGAVILATGGISYPQLGASEDGYSFARSFGHTIIPPVPALVALEIGNKSLLDLQGVKAGTEAKAVQDDKVVASARDEILFTHYGVSGPAVLHVSSFITRGLPGKSTALRLNFFPALSRAELEEKILALWQRNPKRALGNSLMGILPKKIPQVLLRNVLGMNTDTRSDAVSHQDRARIVDALTGLEVKITATRGFKDAQVTSGGVSTAEVDGKTMESRLVKRLYFAGEVLDINGDCGGFNLQFAFTSGYIAGLNSL